MNANVQYLRRPAEIRFARLCGWTIDVAANRVQRGESDLRLTPKAMAVLRELMQRQGTVVRRDDLLGLVWRDGFPTDDVLTHAVTELRRALEDEPRAPKIIETIPKVGYRLIPPVEVIDQPTPTPTVSETPVEAAADAPLEPPHAPRTLWAALAALALFAIALPLVLKPRGIDAPVASATSARARSEVPQLSTVALTSDLAREQFPSLSPDGSSVVYTSMVMEGGSSKLLVKSLDPSAQAAALTDPQMPQRDDHPVWSPDGKQIAFLRMTPEDCSILVVPSSGGRPRKLATCLARMIDYFDWTADSRGLLVTHRGTSNGAVEPSVIERIDLDSGSREPIVYTPKPDGSEDLQPKSSPDGRLVAFRRGAAPYSDLYVMPVTGGAAQRVTALRSRMRGYCWDSDSAHLVFSSDHTGRQELFRIAIAGGEPVALGAVDAHFPAVARNAPVLVFQQESGLMQLAKIALGGGDGSGPQQVIAPSSRSDWFPLLSPTGGKLAFVSLRSGSPQLWIHEFDSGATYPVTHLENTEVAFPQWSPDETQVLFVTRGRGESALHRVQLASARIERLSPATERVRYGSYARDGKSIFYSSDRNGAWQIWRMNADGSSKAVVSSSAGFDPRDFIGDGSLYYVKETDTGLFRLDLATGQERRVSWMIGYWNMDSLLVSGKELYFLDSSDDGHTWLMKAPLHLEGLTRDKDSDSDTTKTRVAELGISQAGSQASIAADLKTVVAITVLRDETDLMSARL